MIAVRGHNLRLAPVPVDGDASRGSDALDPARYAADVSIRDYRFGHEIGGCPGDPFPRAILPGPDPDRIACEG